MPQEPLSDLERTLVTTGSPDAFAAYAAHLAEVGDPLAELIALELEDDPGNAAQVTALRARCAPVKDVGLQWTWGLITAGVAVDNRKTGSGSAWIQAVLPSRAGRLLRDLTLSHNAPTNSYKRCLEALVEAGAPALRALRAVRPGGSGFDAAKGLAAAAPNLVSLHLAGNFSRGALEALCDRWPSLETLSLDLHGTPVWRSPPSARSLAGLLEPAALPRLRHLRLERTGMDDALLDHLGGSGLLPQLEVVQLGGFFSAEAVTAFLGSLPAQCSALLTRYEPIEKRQRIVEMTARPTPGTEADYAQLWVELEEEPWWDSGHRFAGTEVRRQTGLVETVRAVLPDGTPHGRLTTLSSGGRRTDEMYWFGVKQGFQGFFRPGHPPALQTFRNGLRDQRVDVPGPDGAIERVLVYEQGQQRMELLVQETAEQRAAREFLARFGFDFVTGGNEHYTLGPAAEPSAEVRELPAVQRALSTADEGRVIVRPMTMADGAIHQAVLFHLGDTLCGLVLDGLTTVARIEDGELRQA